MLKGRFCMKNIKYAKILNEWGFEMNLWRNNRGFRVGGYWLGILQMDKEESPEGYCEWQIISLNVLNLAKILGAELVKVGLRYILQRSTGKMRE